MDWRAANSENSFAVLPSSTFHMISRSDRAKISWSPGKFIFLLFRGNDGHFCQALLYTVYPEVEGGIMFFDSESTEIIASTIKMMHPTTHPLAYSNSWIQLKRIYYATMQVNASEELLQQTAYKSRSCDQCLSTWW